MRRANLFGINKKTMKHKKLSYRQSTGLTGVNCYLCQYSFFASHWQKVTKVKISKKNSKIEKRIETSFANVDNSYALHFHIFS